MGGLQSKKPGNKGLALSMKPDSNGDSKCTASINLSFAKAHLIRSEGSLIEDSHQDSSIMTRLCMLDTDGESYHHKTPTYIARLQKRVSTVDLPSQYPELSELLLIVALFVLLLLFCGFFGYFKHLTWLCFRAIQCVKMFVSLSTPTPNYVIALS